MAFHVGIKFTILVGADHPTDSLKHPVDSRMPVCKIEPRPSPFEIIMS